MKNMKLTTEFKTRLGAAESVHDVIEAIEGARCFGRLDSIISALVGSRVEVLRDVADKIVAGQIEAGADQAEAPLIEMRTLEKGFAVSFPFALKDNFRAAFPSAKWNPATKHWVVGPRSGKRLEQWIAATEGAAQAAAQLDQLEYDQAALVDLEAELAQVEADLKAKAAEIEALGKQKRTLAELRAALDASKEALVHVEMEAEAAQAEVEAEKAAIDALLAPIVNKEALESAVADMARHHQSVGAKARECFDAAQAVVIHARNQVRAAGWYNEFLEKVADANFNRPDRDNVRSISKAKWYKMRPYEQD
jgi:hypothetical protein